MSRRPRGRTLARRAALQALYQWQMTGQPTAEIAEQFLEAALARRFDRDYFRTLLEGVAGETEALDIALEALIDRPVAQVDPVERALLRLGAFELLRRPEIPWRVAIDEAVALAHEFGAEQGHRYVNGVLDRLARGARAELPG